MWRKWHGCDGAILVACQLCSLSYQGDTVKLCRRERASRYTGDNKERVVSNNQNQVKDKEVKSSFQEGLRLEADTTIKRFPTSVLCL